MKLLIPVEQLFLFLNDRLALWPSSSKQITWIKFDTAQRPLY